jgi:hypothetical protein
MGWGFKGKRGYQIDKTHSAGKLTGILSIPRVLISE